MSMFKQDVVFRIRGRETCN